jgi:thioredoxin reductase (NADPH)
MIRRDVAIVGAGPAGCAAAVQCARLGADVFLMDATGRAGGLVRNGFLVENYPGTGGPIPGEELAARLERHVERFGVEVIRGRALRVSREGGGWSIRTDGGDVPARCVIVATGTEPLRLDADGAAGLAGDRLFYEVRDLLAAFSAPGEVAVIGGGEAAFDCSLSLAAAGAAVTILVRGDRPRAAGALAAAVDRAAAVEVRTGARVVAMARAPSGVVVSVEGAGGGSRLEAGCVLAAVGRLASLPAGDGGTLTEGPGLFICGDARRGALGQVGIAVGDGLAAAAAAVAALARDGTR